MRDTRLFGQDMIQETTEKIRIVQERMKVVQSRQKTYADRHRRPLEFSVGDKVFLKVSSLKEMVCIGRKNKLDHRYD